MMLAVYWECLYLHQTTIAKYGDAKPICMARGSMKNHSDGSSACTHDDRAASDTAGAVVHGLRFRCTGPFRLSQALRNPII